MTASRDPSSPRPPRSSSCSPVCWSVTPSCVCGLFLRGDTTGRCRRSTAVRSAEEGGRTCSCWLFWHFVFRLVRRSFCGPPTEGVATTNREGLRSVGTRQISNNSSYLFLFSNCRHVLCALESYRSLVSGSSDRLVLVVRRDPAERLRTKNRKYKQKKKKHSQPISLPVDCGV